MKSKHIVPQDRKQITESGSLIDLHQAKEDRRLTTQDQFTVGIPPMARTSVF
jgi:hypothetical protein